MCVEICWLKKGDCLRAAAVVRLDWCERRRERSVALQSFCVVCLFSFNFGWLVPSSYTSVLHGRVVPWADMRKRFRYTPGKLTCQWVRRTATSVCKNSTCR